jgi:spore germination protein
LRLKNLAAQQGFEPEQHPPKGHTLSLYNYFMPRKIVLIILTLLLGGVVGFLIIYKYFSPETLRKNTPIVNMTIPQREVIGFLPYWLIGKAQKDYSKYITTLTYFSLSLNKDGTIQKYTKPGESEPGYLALQRGKIDTFLNSAKEKGENLSLTVFSGNDNDINEILKDPLTSANNLTKDIIPIMQEYGFSDLNLDVEQIQDASPAARINFREFVKNIKGNLDNTKAGTVSIDISAIAFVKEDNLADPAALAPLANKIILMAYDYHNTGSFVTGPVAPGLGAGTVSEFDTESALAAALKIMPSQKVILGIPLYGYEWETIENTPRSATIPGTSLIISNKRAEDFLASCATCNAIFDKTDQESHIIYKNDNGTYQQIFYPTKDSTQFKANLANENSLGGIAVWALGYEDKTILEPLSSYHN